MRTLATPLLLLAFLAGCTPAAESGPSSDELVDQIGSLKVEAEHSAGYDRDLFGDYDRSAVLAENAKAFSECDGYYSLADDTCYTFAEHGSKAKADDEVDIDHLVALGEAWDSGAHSWSAGKRDEYAAAVSNLWVMTDNVNQSKSDRDAAGWIPPYLGATCTYVQRYVTVKVKWDLSVDQAERRVLVKLADEC